MLSSGRCSRARRGSSTTIGSIGISTSNARRRRDKVWPRMCDVCKTTSGYCASTCRSMETGMSKCRTKKHAHTRPATEAARPDDCVPASRRDPARTRAPSA
ncbi:hypothetical protein BCR44DRAFT_1044201 [Catenaria anguillulae PL171]|uniref:Uncharacterized protein n=1 Tax=Catenaria anguillulae PL171 TaxID=765915 RepID=A0A1Y2HTR4_9FUNG|nr:hypothetical protein BCR44DRAFT_1044201 [Catenaria anguillulae PL171]